MWVMWLKAIANPGDRRGGFAMALRPTRETAQTNSCPRRGSVLDAVRLRHTGLVRRRKAPMFRGDRAATRSFSCQGGPLLRSGTEGIKLRPPGTGGGSDGQR
jgi:hypothetical protein